MYSATSVKKQRVVVWLAWLLALLVLWQQPALVAADQAGGLADAASAVWVDTPGRELFPWWPRERWRKRALAAYQRWQQARRQAQRTAQLARLALNGMLSLAAIVDWLTKQQLRRQLGAIPVLYAVLEALQVEATINRYCPQTREVANGAVALVLILNRLLAPRPLQWVAKWYAQTMLVHKLGVPAAKFNDDRLARTLDTLAPHCRDIWLAVVSRALELYDIDLRMVFYDLTAFVVHGQYAESDLAQFGFAHNTPMGKRKVKLGLNVSSDGNIPLDYWAWAGNTADKATVERNLQRLCDLLRAHRWVPNQVLLLGDRATLDDKLALIYAKHQIRYLAGLQPQKRVHVELVKHLPEDAFYRHPLTAARGKEGYWGVPVAVPFEYQGDTATHRGLVVLSGPMRSALAQTRAKQFGELWLAMRTIQEKATQQAPRYRSARDVLARADTQLRNSAVGQFVTVSVTGETGAIQLHWQVKRDKLVAAMQQDGRYLLVTNDLYLTPAQMLAGYRQKDGVEKRFTVCKQDLRVSPIYLHQDQRIEAMLLLNMLALLTYSILERQLRQHGLQLTTRRLIEQLETLCVIETHCWDSSVLFRLTPLTPEQARLVERLEAVLQIPWQQVVAWAQIDSRAPPAPLLLAAR